MIDWIIFYLKWASIIGAVCIVIWAIYSVGIHIYYKIKNKNDRPLVTEIRYKTNIDGYEIELDPRTMYVEKPSEKLVGAVMYKRGWDAAIKFTELYNIYNEGKSYQEYMNDEWNKFEEYEDLI